MSVSDATQWYMAWGLLGSSAVDGRMAREDVEDSMTFKVIWDLLEFVEREWVRVC